MNKKKDEDPYMIQRLLAYMDFATELKKTQEDLKRKKQKNKKPNK